MFKILLATNLSQNSRKVVARVSNPSRTRLEPVSIQFSPARIPKKGKKSKPSGRGCCPCPTDLCRGSGEDFCTGGRPWNYQAQISQLSGMDVWRMLHDSRANVARTSCDNRKHKKIAIWLHEYRAIVVRHSPDVRKTFARPL